MTHFIVPAQPRLDFEMLLPRRNGGERNVPRTGGHARTYSMFWGRSAIYHGLRALGIGRGHAVLVPAYHCSAIVEAVLHAGAEPEFYAVHPDCSPQLSDIEARLARGARALLIIHYFGFPQSMQQLRELCNKHRAVLIEDCAHVLASPSHDTAPGTTGDISIFSWRKFLPVYDGGQLVVNRSDLDVDLPLSREDLWVGAKILTNLLDKAVEDSGSAAAQRLAVAWRLPSKLGRQLLRRRDPASHALRVSNYGTDFDIATANLEMSRPSAYILRHLDLAAVTARRRFNYLQLREALASLPGVTIPFPDLPDGVCPLAFPMMIDGEADMHLRLQARGIPAFTWGGVTHPRFAPAEFPEAAALYRDLAWLPVHQSLTADHLSTMLEIVEDLLLHRSCAAL